MRRIISAAVLIPVALGGAVAGGELYAMLVGALGLVMLFEWNRMVEKREITAVFHVLVLTLFASVVLVAGGRIDIALTATAIGSVLAAGVAGLVGRRAGWAALAPLYIIAPCVLLLWIRAFPVIGLDAVLFLLFAVWATDTGAYVAGNLLGGPRLSPAVSPHKTWAGVAGGLAAAVAVSVLGDVLFLFVGFHPILVVLAGASISVAAQIGDVAESAVKRVFERKDTSGFIPGHGGVLDRLDGMIFATTGVAAAMAVYNILVPGGGGN